MHPLAPIIILSPIITLITIVALIIHHRTKVQTRRIEKENDRAALEKILNTISQDFKEGSVSLHHSIGTGSEQLCIIKMTCQKCGGTTEIDSNQQILFCPFCGAKELLVESDLIKEARINASMNERIAKEKHRTVNDLYEQYTENIKTHHREERKDKFFKFIRGTISSIIIIIICVLLIVGIIFFLFYWLPLTFARR